MLHDSYLDRTSGPIGRVVTSEESPATAHEFFFWTAETDAAQNMDIGHIVAAESEDATAVAVLDDPRRYSDLQSFLDDFYAYDGEDRKSTRLNSSHANISYAVFCLKKKHLLKINVVG